MLKVIALMVIGARSDAAPPAADGLDGAPPHADARQNARTIPAAFKPYLPLILSTPARGLPTRQSTCRVEVTVAGPFDATVLICTYNRAVLLGETLDSLAHSRVASISWNVIIVDNNSSDETRDVVTRRIATYPVPLVYVFEPRQGKSHALNTGLAATASALVLFTDDDVRVAEGWVEASCRPMLDDPSIDYTGGPVRPIWEAPCPDWIDRDRADLWGTLAILDYGTEAFVFEDRRRVPLGANMAVRRSLIDRIGGFDPELGRRGRSLLGQEQAEFFCRSRAVDARGMYEPAMEVHHHVPAIRLTRDYFYRWWYWKGISKAVLEQRHPVTELGIDLRLIPKFAGVPRFMIGSAARDVIGWAGALLRGSAVDRVRREVWLCYFAGYMKGLRSAKVENPVRQGPNSRKEVPTTPTAPSLHS
jgi:glycosyltransferase involved in cell wall biosynthesis